MRMLHPYPQVHLTFYRALLFLLALGLKSVLTGIINSKSILNKETNKNILCQRRQASQHFSKIPNGLKLGLLGQNPKELKEQFLFCFFFFQRNEKEHKFLYGFQNNTH